MLFRLRHIERTRILAYVIDISASQKNHPWDEIKLLLHELECYKKGLSKRKAIILANKMDLLSSRAQVDRLVQESTMPVFLISAKTGKNVQESLKEMRKLVQDSYCTVH